MRASVPDPELADVIAFVREFGRFGRRRTVTAETRLDTDLGITGADGVDLLEAVERRFGVAFDTEARSFRQTFGLGPGEFLFGSEGLDLFGIGALVGRLCGKARPVVVDFTVEDLHRAVVSSLPR